MTERRVTVVCEHKDTGAGMMSTNGPCRQCKESGTVPRILADPAIEALIADGERLAHDVEAAYLAGYEDAYHDSRAHAAEDIAEALRDLLDPDPTPPEVAP